MTPHGKLREEITDYLTSIGAWWYATNSQGYGRKGIPDVVGCYRGRFFAIEVKVAPDTPSPWQKRELAAITLSKGATLVAYSLAEVMHIFSQYPLGPDFD